MNSLIKTSRNNSMAPMARTTSLGKMVILNGDQRILLIKVTRDNKFCFAEIPNPNRTKSQNPFANLCGHVKYMHFVYEDVTHRWCGK